MVMSPTSPLSRCPTPAVLAARLPAYPGRSAGHRIEQGAGSATACRCAPDLLGKQRLRIHVRATLG